ncbi:MAG: cation diffusion facilitator family transporter [Candidatus Dormibacteraeota bacterium]|nr:cation diffusion facilitator family transporter [Candidatus Dormibacteraeota bacterium]
MATHRHPDTSAGAPDRSLRLALALTVAIVAIQLAGGLWSHSLALLADAGHVAADVLGLALAWFAAVQSRRPADPRRTYGYHRVGILAAVANSIALVLVVGVIALEAVRRLLHPEPVTGGVVVAAALLAIVVNAYVAWRLRHGGHDLNLRAALLHVLGDLASAAGVVAAGLIILFTGWLYADPLISLAICGVIVLGAVRIARESLHVLMEGTPRGVDLEAVESELLAGRGVRSVHDLHVWTVSPEHSSLSAHLVVDQQSVEAGEHLVRDLETRLCQRFGVGHTTIQLETCHPCPEDLEHGAGDHNHPHPVQL